MPGDIKLHYLPQVQIVLKDIVIVYINWKLL